MCIHGDIRSMCRMCVYSELCEHGYAKKACTVCSKK
jgi:ATP sulfurylase